MFFFAVTGLGEGVVVAVLTMRYLQGLQNRPVGMGVWSAPLQKGVKLSESKPLPAPRSDQDLALVMEGLSVRS